MGLFSTKPFRLPRLKPHIASPNDPPIFSFNDERSEIVTEVAARVSEAHSGSREQLEYALNDVALREAERLSRQRDDEARRHLGRWQGLLRRIARMTDGEKRDALSDIAARMTGDVAGNFDPRVYKLSENVVPRLITAVMSPSKLPKYLLSPQDQMKDLVRVEGPVEDLQSLAKQGTLIFVPTHSSNLDSVVLGWALQSRGLPPVIYGAGKNLFTNPIISFFMHNLGAYRVDRRIKAALYKEVLKTYSSVMIERGYHSLFFPGGTRSRSGLIESKLKLGLAGTGVEAFAQNQVRGTSRPVWFVPTTINYALVLEAESLIEDHLKETGKARYIIEDDEFSRIDRWVSFFRQIVNMSGACVVRFGMPIDPFGNDVDRDGQSLSPKGKPVDSGTYVSQNGKPVLDAARDRAYTRYLGDVLRARYRSETVIMETQLVAHVLYRRLVRSTPGADVFVRVRHRGDVSMARDELVSEVQDARDALVELERQGQVHVSDRLRDEPGEHIVDYALRAFNGYHTRTAACALGAEVTAHDPTLLLFYQNRLVDFAERISDAVNMQAAQEIAHFGAMT